MVSSTTFRTNGLKSLLHFQLPEESQGRERPLGKFNNSQSGSPEQRDWDHVPGHQHLLRGRARDLPEGQGRKKTVPEQEDCI